MPKKIVQVELIKFLLVVEDMDRGLNFYRNVFGLEIASQSIHWSELRFGEVIIALHSGGSQERRKTGLSFQVGDIDAACQQVQQAGGKVLAEPESRPGEPIKLARALDPEGNEFDLTEFVGE